MQIHRISNNVVKEVSIFISLAIKGHFVFGVELIRLSATEVMNGWLIEMFQLRWPWPMLSIKWSITQISSYFANSIVHNLMAGDSIHSIALHVRSEVAQLVERSTGDWRVASSRLTPQQSHCVVSLSRTLYPLLNTTQEDRKLSQIFDLDVKHQNKETKQSSSYL